MIFFFVFLHEHPMSAMNWSEPCIKEVTALPAVADSVCDQCMYGCWAAETKSTPSVLARKSTRFVSNGPEMLSQWNRRCDGSHEHKQLRGKDLDEAAFDPAKLMHPIIKGIHLTNAAAMLKCIADGTPDTNYLDYLCSASRMRGYGTESQVLGACQMKRTDGSTQKVT